LSDLVVTIAYKLAAALALEFVHLVLDLICRRVHVRPPRRGLGAIPPRDTPY